MTETEVVELMESCQTSAEWRAACNRVKAVFDGYPEFWFTAIVQSGIAGRVARRWGGTDKITVVTGAQEPKPPDDRILPLWVVYDHPLDFPQHAVVRQQWAVSGSDEPRRAPVACLFDTLEEAMVDCRDRGLYWIGRSRDDDIAIYGVWI